MFQKKFLFNFCDALRCAGFLTIAEQFGSTCSVQIVRKPITSEGSTEKKKLVFLDTLYIGIDVVVFIDIDVDDQIETCSVIVGGAGLVNNQGDCNVTAGSTSGAQTVKPCPKL